MKYGSTIEYIIADTKGATAAATVGRGCDSDISDNFRAAPI
jgi:hypothetical protein